MDSVGAYEAKTHLPRLLEAVAAGSSITITKHGRSVARLVPAHKAQRDPAEVAADLRAARRGKTRGDRSVREMIDEGRR
ncbi:MAG: type II toxin-antitoxin system prevent-host-death family antitoxin [Mycobacteriales bacterium]